MKDALAAIVGGWILLFFEVIFPWREQYDMSLGQEKGARYRNTISRKKPLRRQKQRLKSKPSQIEGEMFLLILIKHLNRQGNRLQNVNRFSRAPMRTIYPVQSLTT